jgi:hypothetical protein
MTATAVSWSTSSRPWKSLTGEVTNAETVGIADVHSLAAPRTSSSTASPAPDRDSARR